MFICRSWSLFLKTAGLNVGQRKKLGGGEVWEDYLKKDRGRNKAKRRLKKIERLTDQTLIEEKREKERLRKRAARERKKQAALEGTPTVENSSRLGTYKCSQTLRKAVKKLRESLPYSPSKKLAVIKEFIKDSVKERLVTNVVPETSISPGKRVLTTETIDKVLAYYENDKVSRQTPGKRDKKSVKDPNTGKGSLIQIRHMLVTISESYEMFKIENENTVISKSKFYKLRPQHILPVSETPHNVCVCKYHYNFSSITA